MSIYIVPLGSHSDVFEYSHSPCRRRCRRNDGKEEDAHVDPEVSEIGVVETLRQPAGAVPSTRQLMPGSLHKTVTWKLPPHVDSFSGHNGTIRGFKSIKR